MSQYTTDTRPQAEQIQLALLRAASPAQRLDLAADLTRMAITAARDALRRRYPHATEQEINLLFVEHHYGRALAQRLRDTL